MDFSFLLSQEQGPPYYPSTGTSIGRYNRVTIKIYYMIDYMQQAMQGLR